MSHKNAENSHVDPTHLIIDDRVGGERQHPVDRHGGINRSNGNITNINRDGNVNIQKRRNMDGIDGNDIQRRRSLNNMDANNILLNRNSMEFNLNDGLKKNRTNFLLDPNGGSSPFLNNNGLNNARLDSGISGVNIDANGFSRYDGGNDSIVGCSGGSGRSKLKTTRPTTVDPNIGTSGSFN